MAKYETSEKKPKKRSRVGLVLLVLLLILAGAVGYLYYSVCKAPLELDDPQKLTAAVPMKAADRFSFSAADGTAQVKLDKADLWYLILTHAGNDFLDTVNKEVAPYGLEVSGCAIRINEEGLQLDLELFYKEVRLIAGVPCDLEVSGQRFCLKPAGVKLGVISLPVEKLLSRVKLEYELVLPVIPEVTGVSFAPGAIVLTGPVEQDVRALLPLGKELDRAVVFSEAYQPLADALRSEKGFVQIMSHLEQHPASVEDLYRELFTLAEPEVTETYLEDRQGLTERFFSGVDFSTVEQLQQLLTKELTLQYIALEKFFTAVVNEYNEKRLSIRDSAFIYQWQPFNAAQFEERKNGTAFEVLDPEPVFLIVVDAKDGFIRKTSSFYRMVDENQPFTQDVDFDKTYILGCVFRSVDGDPYLLYEKEVTENNFYVRQIKLQDLTEEEVTALQEPGKIGVWTN